MKVISELGEVALIRRFSRRLGGQTPSVRVGIGDDAAVLRGSKETEWLLASDMLVEGVHFMRQATPAKWIGWKALACNVSDIAAMGGLPYASVVSLGLPPRTPLAFVEGVYDGLARCARRFGVSIVGGDTVRAPVVVIDVAILGTVKRPHLTLRSGARAGDRLFVTGHLGGSLSSGRHATFVPRLSQAQWLVRHLRVHAMIDLSDGLASDLWQVARASRVTLQVREADIPVSRAAKTIRHALMDGEDFELLFAVPSRMARRVPKRLGGVPVTEIGIVTRQDRCGVELIQRDGRRRPLVPQGFKHF
jgi:thiamine-monophosphate kinase